MKWHHAGLAVLLAVPLRAFAEPQPPKYRYAHLSPETPVPQATTFGHASVSERAVLEEDTVTYVADDFETGDLSKWTGTQAFSCPDSTNITVSRERPKNGTYSARIRYVIRPNPPGPCGGHSDQNIYFHLSNADPSCGAIGSTKAACVEGWVYLKTPEAGAAHPAAVQRKFFRFLTNSNHGRSTWGVGLTCDGDPNNARCGARIFSDNGPPSWSLFGGNGDQPSESPRVYNGIFDFRFDTWYYIKFCVRAKSAPRADDTVVKFWVNGTLEFSKSSNWASISKDPIPADNETEGLNHVRIGEQVDRVSGDDGVDEYRYWDDVKLTCTNNF